MGWEKESRGIKDQLLRGGILEVFVNLIYIVAWHDRKKGMHVSWNIQIDWNKSLANKNTILTKSLNFSGKKNDLTLE